MCNILILYPKQFNSYSKFIRKVEKILSRLENVNLYFLSDPNGLIREACSQLNIIDSVQEIQDLSVSDISHAIVFDDGEEFLDEIVELKSIDIPTRIIKIAITRVINLKVETDYQTKKSTSDYEYIGRGSYWGNPYSMFEEGDDRDEVIRKYKYDFDYEKFPNKEKSEVYKLAGKRLGCFCKPQACHGDVLADYLNSWDDGK